MQPPPHTAAVAAADCRSPVLLLFGTSFNPCQVPGNTRNFHTCSTFPSTSVTNVLLLLSLGLDTFLEEVSLLHHLLIWFLTPRSGFSPVLTHPIFPLGSPQSRKLHAKQCVRQRRTNAKHPAWLLKKTQKPPKKQKGELYLVLHVSTVVKCYIIYWILYFSAECGAPCHRQPIPHQNSTIPALCNHVCFGQLGQCSKGNNSTYVSLMHGNMNTVDAWKLAASSATHTLHTAKNFCIPLIQTGRQKK